MHGSAQYLLQFMEGSSNRFFIPVYQRNYEWKLEQCKQLYDDLIKVSNGNRKSHFFGSIVSTPVENGGMGHHLLIDGQQRVTTVSLLLLALANSLNSGFVFSANPMLSQKIIEEYLIDKFAADDAQKLKLKTAKDDLENYSALIANTADIPQTTNLAINYTYFFDRIKQGELSPDDLYDSISKLEIINIYLGKDDNAQLIFESLNSTGLDLSEGDKVRNFALMGLSTTLQEKYFKVYWHEIEKNTEFNVSYFLRDYLSIKNQVTPVISRIYPAFKDFSQKFSSNDIEPILKDLLLYSKIYGQLLTPTQGSDKLQRSIHRLDRFEATVTRPFLMEVLRTARKDPSLFSMRDVENIFILVESYLLRRQVSDIPSNALNKIFVTLHRDILRLDGTLNQYFEKLNYILLQKTESGVFPNDELFISSLSTKRIYQMRPKSKQYILERLENGDSKEYKNVWSFLDNGVYSIEHVMPQTLTTEWKAELGENYQEIHNIWLDRLANLTLTAYNPNYSNSSFSEKKSMENGFLSSGIAMNLEIASFANWDLSALVDRDDRLMKKAVKLWPMAKTSYQPPEDQLEVLSLADEIDFSGRDIVKFSIEGTDQTTENWDDFVAKAVKLVYINNPTPLNQALSVSRLHGILDSFIIGIGDITNATEKISDNLYLKKNIDNNSKLSLLRFILNIYQIEESEFLLFTKKKTQATMVDTKLHSHRYRFWDYALPLLRLETQKFENHNPTTSNWIGLSYGIKGIDVYLNAQLRNCRVDLAIKFIDRQRTTNLYNYLHKSTMVLKLQSKISYPITWQNKLEQKTAYMMLTYPVLGISSEADWDACVSFYVQAVQYIEKEYLPLVRNYLKEIQ